MHFSHAPEMWSDFSELAAAACVIGAVDAMETATDSVKRLTERGRDRLGDGPPSDLAEISAWRRTFTKMGLKPTQYRCASEALLRRLSKEGDLPSLHPLVDLGNAVSVAFALPVAVFDLDHVNGDLVVRRASGSETYEAFGGEIEHPAAGEVVFADTENRAHARRWTNRQAATSAARATTRRALVVIEGMHPTAEVDTLAAANELISSLGEGADVVVPARGLTADAPVLEVA